jgi:DNA replication protein DnaC
MRCPNLGTERKGQAAGGLIKRHGLLKSLARVELLILDDWGLTTLTAEQVATFEIVEDRHNRRSTIVSSQLPVGRRRNPRSRARKIAVILHRIWIDGTTFRWAKSRFGSED